MKNKGETVLNHKLFVEINILKIVKYLVKYIFLLFQYCSEWFHNDATDTHNKCFLRILKHLVKKKKKIEKENSHELQASINGKKSINVLLFASFTFFLIIYNNCNY